MDAGDLTVKYNIVSSKAEAALTRVAAKLKQVEEYAVKSGKAITKSMKASSKAYAAFGAITVGVLYAIIRGSSYAAMWTDQFSASLTRLSNALLRITGLDKAIDEFLKKFDEFSVALDEGKLGEWVKNLSLAEKAIIGITIVLGILIGLWAIVAGYGVAVAAWGVAMVAWKVGLVAIGAKLAAVGALILSMPLWLAIAVGAVLGLIAVWILWKTGVLDAIYNLGERFGTWVQELGAKFATWVAGLGEKFGNWIVETKEKLGTFKTWMFEKFDEIWAHIITGLTNMKADFFSIIDKIIGKIGKLITKILAIPKSIAGGGGGVYKTTSSTSRSSGFATGAHITSSGAAGVHAGEDIVRLKSLLAGIRTDQAGGNTSNQSVTNNVTVNVTSAMNNSFEIDAMVEKVSRRLTSELGRISTSI